MWSLSVDGGGTTPPLLLRSEWLLWAAKAALLVAALLASAAVQGRWKWTKAECGSGISRSFSSQPMQDAPSTEEAAAKKRKKKRTAQPLPPGPAGWPVVGNLLQVGSVPHFGMRRLNERYGPLVYLRLGSVPAVVTDDPALVREFLRKQDHVFSSRPSNIASEHFTYGGRDIAFAPYGEHWRAMRRLCLLKLLTPRRLREHAAGRWEEVRCMAAEVAAASAVGTPINLRNTFGALSSNTLTRMILGKRFFGPSGSNAVSAAEHKSLIYVAFAILNSFNIGDYLPFLRSLDLQGRERAMRRIMAWVDDLYDRVIDEYRRSLQLRHQKQKKNVSDGKHSETAVAGSASASDDEDGDEDGDPSSAHSSFLELLLSLPGENGEPHLDQRTIKAVLIDLVAAGTDTSSITSEWTMAELMKHPEAMEKVREEIDRVVGKERAVEERDLSQLQQLKAVVKEIFRLHPVGAFLIPHVSIEETEVAGYRIPKGTRVLINTYSMGRNPKVWDDAEEFKPERFLTENVELTDADLRIVPFGAGRRGCPGATLGSSVVLLGLATLIQGFRWTPVSQGRHLKEADGLMVLENPLEAMATLRVPPHFYDINKKKNEEHHYQS